MTEEYNLIGTKDTVDAVIARLQRVSSATLVVEDFPCETGMRDVDIKVPDDLVDELYEQCEINHVECILL